MYQQCGGMQIHNHQEGSKFDYEYEYDVCYDRHNKYYVEDLPEFEVHKTKEALIKRISKDL